MKKRTFYSLLLIALLATTIFVAVACQDSDPPPSVAEPEPSVAEPEPSVAEPKPSVVEPEPSVGEPEPPTATTVDDVATQWREPALEALVREKLSKPEGDIMLSELDYVWGG